MTFQFDSMGDLLIMAGHGPYVWGAYVITSAVLTYLIVTPVRKHRRFLQEQKRIQRVQNQNFAPVK